MNSATQILSTADDSAASPGAHTMSEQFCRANEESALSEERFRDLFDEAPIAYVLQGLDSRIIQANRTAMRMLGVKLEERRHRRRFMTLRRQFMTLRYCTICAKPPGVAYLSRSRYSAGAAVLGNRSWPNLS